MWCGNEMEKEQQGIRNVLWHSSVSLAWMNTVKLILRVDHIVHCSTRHTTTGHLFGIAAAPIRTVPTRCCFHLLHPFCYGTKSIKLIKKGKIKDCERSTSTTLVRWVRWAFLSQQLSLKFVTLLRTHSCAVYRLIGSLIEWVRTLWYALRCLCRRRWSSSQIFMWGCADVFFLVRIVQTGEHTNFCELIQTRCTQHAVFNKVEYYLLLVQTITDKKQHIFSLPFRISSYRIFQLILLLQVTEQSTFPIFL